MKAQDKTASSQQQLATRASGGLQTTEDTGLSTRSTATGELAATSEAAAVTAEIQAAVVLAKRFPRDQDRIYAEVLKTTKNARLAEKASYRYKRGGTDVSGPSVYLARELGRMWGNVRTGFVVTRDAETERSIEAFAWDLETNYYQTAGATFSKLQQRKTKDAQGRPTGETRWVVPDERDLREVTNKHAAIAQRNCLLQVLPKWLVDEAEELCAETRRTAVKADPDAARKKVIAAFAELRIDPSGPGSLAEYLGCPVDKASPAQIAELREIYQSIRDGNSVWVEYLEGAGAKARAKVEVDDLVGKEVTDKAPPASTASPLTAENLAALRADAEARGVSWDAVEAEWAGLVPGKSVHGEAVTTQEVAATIEELAAGADGE